MTKKIAISAVLFLLGLIIITNSGDLVDVFDMSPLVHTISLLLMMFGGGAVSMVGAYLFADATSTH